MATILAGIGAILLVAGWITFDHWWSKRKLDKQHNGVIKSCKVEPQTYVSPLLSTVALETEVENKFKEVEGLRQKTDRVRARQASRETTRKLKPKTDPISDSQILKVVVDQAEEVKKAAREKIARKR
jgi:hypothetical protein